MLATEPVTKLSMAMTLWPRASSKSTRCDPRKPAPPVTTETGRRFEVGRAVRFGMGVVIPQRLVRAQPAMLKGVIVKAVIGNQYSVMGMSDGWTPPDTALARI